MNPFRPAVVSNVIRIEHSPVLNNRPVHIGVMDNRFIYPHHRGVIGKSAVSPFAAGKTNPAVTESVINAAIVPDFISPVPIVESIGTVVPAPVGRRPERALVRSRHPCAGHPVIVPAIV